MSALFFCLVLAVWPAIGGQQGAELAPIALYTQFQQEPPQAVLESLQDEVESIMSPIGLHFDWRSLTATRGNEAHAELAVVKFRGKCGLSAVPPHATSSGPLGWTYISEGVILPYSDVDCDRTRAFVHKDLMGLRIEERDKIFGRALGRILAHELFHIFANTQHHLACGVGKAAYTVRDLLSSDFRFDEQDLMLLRNSKAYTVLENAATAAPPEL
jgi:hypothetical protein